MEAQGRTFAKRLNVRRNVKFSDTCPLPTTVPRSQHIKMFDTNGNRLGVASGPTHKLQSDNSIRPAMHRDAPLRATVFFFTDWIADSGMTVLPPFNTGETLTSSHCTGTCVSRLISQTCAKSHHEEHLHWRRSKCL